MLAITFLMNINMNNNKILYKVVTKIKAKILKIKENASKYLKIVIWSFNLEKVLWLEYKNKVNRPKIEEIVFERIWMFLSSFLLFQSFKSN